MWEKGNVVSGLLIESILALTFSSVKSLHMPGEVVFSQGRLQSPDML